MTIKRKCEACNCKATTWSSLRNFHKVGWSAWNARTTTSKAKCYCPRHQEEFKESAPFLLCNQVSEVNK